MLIYMNNNKGANNNKGVSLAELSIVLAVIGLLLAAVIGGLGIRKSSELRGFMTDISGFQVSIEGFDSKYSDLPGDMSDAFTYWNGSSCSAAGTNTECNGDSDGRIEIGPGSSVSSNETVISSVSDVEAFRAWQHLVLSEFLTGNYTGIATTPSGGSNKKQTDIGVNIPASKRVKVGYSIAYSSARDRNEITVGAFYSDNLNTNAALTPTEALAIDKKIDDGVPTTGLVYGFDGSDVTATNCVLTGAYNIANTAAACIATFPAKP